MTSPPRQVLLSACLLGKECRYDGGHNRDRVLEQQLAAQGEVAVPFCPEEVGGLTTPRPAAWIVREGAEAVLAGRDRLETDAGRDVTAEFVAGARAALHECRAHGIDKAYLKERSPSCGVCFTHVGGKLVAGPGVTAALLASEGIAVLGVEGRRQTRE